MMVANYSEFRTKMKYFLDKVEDDSNILIIKRNGSKGAVLMSLDDYNSLMETMYLLSSETNAQRLMESIKQVEEGKVIKGKLLK